MSEPSSLTRVEDDGGPRRRRVEVFIAVLVCALVGLSIAKPWSTSVASRTEPGQSSDAAIPSALGGISARPPDITPDPAVQPGRAPGTGGQSPAAFTLPAPPPATASWTGIRWRRLAKDDQLAAIRSTLRWRGGFVALGPDVPGATPVWMSIDGAHWEPVPVTTSTTNWPGLRLLGVFEMPQGLMAITDLGDASHCPGGLGCMAFMSWTSSDGREWAPLSVFSREQPNTTVPAQLAAVGPAGVVVVSAGTPSQAVTSRDGVAWTGPPDGTFPAGYVISDLRGTATGYVAGGFKVTDGTRRDAATLWSADGQVWIPSEELRPADDPSARSTPGGTRSTVVMSIVPGRTGMIAIGRELAAPGAVLWWQSPDGRAWQPLPGFPPLGTVPCTPSGCGGQANGLLISDGQRMLAVRGSSDAQVSTSFDGIAWQALRVTGDHPVDEAIRAVALPGGLLLFDGTTTWFGEAIAR